jgi:hypothetical protein
MRTFSALFFLVGLAGGLAAGEEGRIAPQPRMRLDPVTRAAVAEQAAKVAAEATARATQDENGAAEAGDASPILLGKFVVREQGTGPREAPKQETFEGRFSPLKGGRLWSGKLGGAKAEIGFWSSLEFTKVGSSVMREDGPRLRVDMLRMKW